MKFKKCSFISLMIIFIVSMFGIFSNAHAINYRFDTKCGPQNLSNKDSFTVDLNLVEGYGSYLCLNTFVLKIKFNRNLFDFKGITPSKNVRSKDLIIENHGDTIEIKFNPHETRIIPFSNSFAEILKANFVCKSDICRCHSYLKTDIIDCSTQENLLSKFTEITIENRVPETIGSSTNNSKNCVKKYPANQTSGDCHLKSIIPSISKLTPSFDPNIFKYKVEVPRNTQEVYFDIVPMSENTDVRVNKHRLGAPGTITYINITSKNKSGSLCYLIEVKRSIDSSEPNADDKFDFKFSYKAEACSKIKNAKHKRNKHKKGRKNSNDNSCEEYDEDEDEDENEAENPGTSENNDNNNSILSLSSTLKDNKIYWIFAFVVLISSIAMYLFLKRKSKLSKNKQDTPEEDINNFFKK